MPVWSPTRPTDFKYYQSLETSMVSLPAVLFLTSDPNYSLAQD
ncbi:hypothetical protein EYZ11_009574 [Aspergillus tanneri]|uniref:Uncharacterized protein n=1 Tax=Aspergillus tanneri TaxID=1220188 RepID=A0A4S3J7K6_9EURO|nr:hypothetical protein EYZ11_009574 [Aspergillus tanneri]